MRARALLLGVLAAALLPAAASAQGTRPPENPVGARVWLSAASFAPGAPIAYAGTGFVQANGQPQVVNVKLNDVDIVATVTAAADGSIGGTVNAPTGGGAFWLRFLAGAGGPPPDTMQLPARSLVADFTVAAPVTTPPPAAAGPAISSTALKRDGGSVSVRLWQRGTVSTQGRLTLKSVRRVRIKGKLQAVDVARAKDVELVAGKRVTAKLTLTDRGRALLRRNPSIKVTVRLAAASGEVVKSTLTLRR